MPHLQDRRKEGDMKMVEESNALETATEATRREALRVGGGAALAALLTAGSGGRVLAAQEANPEASPAAGDGLVGRYVAVRLRKLKTGVSADELIALGETEVVPMLRAIPGFVLYFGSINPASGDGIFVDVYADRAGAEESTRRVQEWLAANAYDFWEGDPIVAEGVIAFAAEADRTSA
jgi:hypothetical protein